MKKDLLLLTLIALIAVGYGCSDDDNKSVNKLPVCEITSPTNGAILDLYEDLIIKGTASDEDGTITKVEFTTNGLVIPAVYNVPFEYTIPAKDLREGKMNFSLTVEDNNGGSAKKSISITIQDNSNAPTCSLTAPEHGATLNVFAPFTIKGEGEAVSGEISSVILKVNGTAIPEVTTLPFEYIVEAEKYPIGEYSITIDVENNRGKVAKDMVSITLADKNIAPTSKITSPEEGTEFEPEDAIVIKGEAEDEDGTIAKATLKINDVVIPAVTSVPFEYALSDEEKEAGTKKIVLEVEDNNGKTSSSEVSITVLGLAREFTDTRDGKVYKTMKIGTQEWFSENLAYLPAVSGLASISPEVSYYYVYGYDGTDVGAAKATDSYKTRGVLYNWTAVGGDKNLSAEVIPSGIQGPCPTGWHMPNLSEWNILFKYVRDRIPEEESAKYWDGSTVYNVSGHLRSVGDWPIKSDNDFPQLSRGGMDTYGFKAQVTGQVLKSGDSGGFYYGPDVGGGSFVCWTPAYDAVSYPNNPGGVSISLDNYRYESSASKGSDANRAYAVRCLKD